MSMSSSTLAPAEIETQERVSAREARFLLQTYQRSPVTIDRGEGCVFWDIEGRRYLDFITGIGVNALGHSHPRLVRTLQAQAEQCLHTSNLFYHRYQGLLAERLAEWSGLSRVFFSNSGTEAVETALKAARAAGNRRAAAEAEDCRAAQRLSRTHAGCAGGHRTAEVSPAVRAAHGGRRVHRGQRSGRAAAGRRRGDGRRHPGSRARAKAASIRCLARSWPTCGR